MTITHKDFVPTLDFIPIFQNIFHDFSYCTQGHGISFKHNEDEACTWTSIQDDNENKQEKQTECKMLNEDRIQSHFQLRHYKPK